MFALNGPPTPERGDALKAIADSIVTGVAIGTVVASVIGAILTTYLTGRNNLNRDKALADREDLRLEREERREDARLKREEQREERRRDRELERELRRMQQTAHFENAIKALETERILRQDAAKEERERLLQFSDQFEELAIPLAEKFHEVFNFYGIHEGLDLEPKSEDRDEMQRLMDGVLELCRKNRMLLGPQGREIVRTLRAQIIECIRSGRRAASRDREAQNYTQGRDPEKFDKLFEEAWALREETGELALGIDDRCVELSDYVRKRIGWYHENEAVDDQPTQGE